MPKLHIHLMGLLFEQEIKMDFAYLCTIWCKVNVCVKVLRPSQPNGVMSGVVNLPSHTFTGQA